jgi:translocation and assembly module TamB
MPRWLMLAIDDVAISEFALTSPRGAQLRLRDVRGSATVSRSRIDFEDAAADAGNWAVAGGSGRILARNPVAIAGGAAWSLTSDRRLVGIARAAGDLDRLLVSAQIAAPGKGTAEIELTRLRQDLRWTGTAEITHLALDQWIDAPPFGPLRGTLKGQGDRSTYTITGLVHGEGLPAAGVAAAGVAGYSDRLVTVRELTLSAPQSTTVRIEGTMTAGEQPAFDMRATWTDFAWPLVGPAVLRSSTGSLQAKGWREFDYRLAGRFQPRQGPAATGSLSGRFTKTALIVDESSVQALGGRFEAQGMLARGEERAWTISGRAHEVDPATLRKDLPGRLSFAYSASGSDIDEDARWAVAISELSGRFRGQPLRGGGIVRRQSGFMQFERVALSLGPARLRLDGALGRETTLEGTLVADDLSEFLPELGGHVDATVQVRGSSVVLSITGHNMAWEKHQAVVLSADAKIDLEDRQTSWLRLRTTGLEVAGQTLTDARLSIDGLMRDHGVAFRVGAGEDAVEMRGHGSYIDRRYTLDTQSVVAAGPRTPHYQLEAPTRLQASAEDARLTPACFIDGARRVCVEGSWQRNADWSLRAGTQSFPLEALDLRVPGRPRYRGLLFAEAHLSGRAGQPWLADVRAEIRDAVFQYQTASGKEQSLALGRTLMTLKSDPQSHRFNLRVEDAEAAEVTAEMLAVRSAGTPLGELPLTGQVRGATRQLNLLPLLFDDIDQASGSLTLDFEVAGRLAAPRLEGQARLAGGSLDFYQANLRLREMQATLELQQTGLELEATAFAGDGTLAVDGRLDWKDRRLNGVLTMHGERLLLVDVPEARVRASPDLRFTLDDRRIEVTGTVNIPQARIVPAKTAGAVLVSSDERILRPELESDGQPRFEVASDIQLLLGDKVDLDAYGLSGRITGAVRARSQPHETAVASGELEIEKGRYRAYTRELDVERGRLLFTGGPVTDPGVDLRASRKLPGHTVGVIVRGRLRRPQLTLYSEPPLPQAQIASMLVVGHALDNLQGDDRDSLDAERASLAAQGGALLAGQLGRYVGLDEAGVAQDSDTGTALVLGKFLSPRLYVSYGISLVDEINTLKLRYTIGDRWVLSAEAGLESAADIEYRIEH